MQDHTYGNKELYIYASKVRSQRQQLVLLKRKTYFILKKTWTRKKTELSRVTQYILKTYNISADDLEVQGV